MSESIHKNPTTYFLRVTKNFTFNSFTNRWWMWDEILITRLFSKLQVWNSKFLVHDKPKHKINNFIIDGERTFNFFQLWATHKVFIFVWPFSNLIQRLHKILLSVDFYDLLHFNVWCVTSRISGSSYHQYFIKEFLFQIIEIRYTELAEPICVRYPIIQPNGKYSMKPNTQTHYLSSNLIVPQTSN